MLPLESRRLEKYFKFYKKLKENGMQEEILNIENKNRLRCNKRKSFLEKKIYHLKRILKPTNRVLDRLNADKFKKLLINIWIKNLNDSNNNIIVNKFLVNTLKYNCNIIVNRF